MTRTEWMKGAALALALTTGCAAGIDPQTPPDAGTTPDGGIGADEIVLGEPVSKVVALSAAGSDGFYGTAFDAQGRILAAGFKADGVEATSDRSMVVARFLPTGELDTTFGTGGVATHNVAAGGGNGEQARSVVVQSTGKIVIAGVIEHDVQATGQAAKDRDLALVRFDADGALDTTFGEAGVVRLDLNTGVETTGSNGPAWSGADALWSVALAPNDSLVLHGNQRAEGFLSDGTTPRSDTDWVLVRLGANGAVDTTFGTNGRFTLDIDKVNGAARGALVLADGSVLAGGYANTPSLGSQQAVIYKVTPAGALDPRFGVNGVWHEIVLPTLTEVYAMGLQGERIVTAGYGRSTTSDSVDWVSLRLNDNGTLDPSWGTDGAVKLDVAGKSDNAYDLVVLPDERVLIAGRGSPEEGKTDGMIALLDTSGRPDTTFAPQGRRLFDLGGSADAYWGAALSPDKTRIAIAGLKGAGSTPSAENNDDAAILIVPLTK